MKRSGGDRTWIHDDVGNLGLAVKIIAQDIEAAYRNPRAFARRATRGVRNNRLITHIVAPQHCDYLRERRIRAGDRHAIREPLVMERVVSNRTERQWEWVAR